jgi:hypothetical protein
LKAKGEVIDKIKQYKALVKNQMGRKIENLQSNNGGHFVYKKFDSCFIECGIQQQPNVQYSPQ